MRDVAVGWEFAVIVNLLLPVLMYVAAPIVLLILGALIAGNQDWAEGMVGYLPCYYIGEGISATRRPTVRMPAGGDTSYVGFVTCAVVVGLVHLAIAGGILAYLSVRFDRIVGRALSSVTILRYLYRT